MPTKESVANQALSDSDKHEIRGSYRDAKKKYQQIGILSQLYACDRNTILEVLQIEEPVRKKSGRGRKSTYSEEVKQEAIRLYCEGFSAKQIKQKLGYSYTTVYSWIHSAIEAGEIDRQKEFFYSEEIKDKACQEILSGKSKKQVSDEMSVPYSTVITWTKHIKAYKKGFLELNANELSEREVAVEPRNKYSDEVKQKVVRAVFAGAKQKDVAAEMGVNIKTVSLWVRTSKKNQSDDAVAADAPVPAEISTAENPHRVTFLIPDETLIAQSPEVEHKAESVAPYEVTLKEWCETLSKFQEELIGMECDFERMMRLYTLAEKLLSKPGGES